MTDKLDSLTLSREQMKRSRWVLVVSVWVVATIGVVIGIYHFLVAPYERWGHVAAEFWSADNQVRCVVLESSPFPMYSPDQYRWELRDARGRLLPGQTIQTSTDSCSVGNFKAQWTTTGVTVWGDYGAAGICDYSDGMQRWHWGEPGTNPR